MGLYKNTTVFSRTKAFFKGYGRKHTPIDNFFVVLGAEFSGARADSSTNPGAATPHPSGGRHGGRNRPGEHRGLAVCHGQHLDITAQLNLIKSPPL